MLISKIHLITMKIKHLKKGFKEILSAKEIFHKVIIIKTSNFWKYKIMNSLIKLIRIFSQSKWIAMTLWI